MAAGEGTHAVSEFRRMVSMKTAIEEREKYNSVMIFKRRNV